uniref:Reverse transcriptase domain-containing protein n=1 Tax=Solanum lycopersicum TaxID=4081 RepID=A0A3Q7IUH9_SOLLC
MNEILCPYLDQLVVVYLYDIVVYSSTLQEHVEHLKKVFKVLRENQLYVEREKCQFAQPKIHFLGHVISQGELRMDEAKVKAIQDWEAPMKVTELRYFLGLDKYYRRFISGYSAIAAPLTELLKKNRFWLWSEECQEAFEVLKAVVTEAPVLMLPDFTKTFEIHMDASDFAIGGPLENRYGRTTLGVACHHRLWTSRHSQTTSGLTRSDDVGRGMPSSPLGSTDGRKASGVACHNRPWTAQTVGRRRAWHAVIALGQHKRSATVGRAYTQRSGPMAPKSTCRWLSRRNISAAVTVLKYNFHGAAGRILCRRLKYATGYSRPRPSGICQGLRRMGLDCKKRPWTTLTVERRRAWRSITALGQHTQSDDIGHGMPSPPLDITHHDITTLGQHTQSNDVVHGMTSPPVDYAHAHMVKQRRAWHDLTALGQHTRSYYVGRGMTSPPLDSTRGRTTSGHTWSNDVRRGMASPPLDSTHGRTTPGVTCITAFRQHSRSNDVGRGMPSSPLAAQTVERRRAWHDITALGLHARSDDIWHGMTSPPFDGTHG